MFVFDNRYQLAQCVLTHHRQFWIVGLREAVRRVIMGSPDLYTTALRLQCNSGINNQPLRSPNTEVRMEENYPCHPVGKNEYS